MAKKLKVTQIRSSIGSQEKKHKRVMESLGFRRNYRTIYKNDSPQIRGMLKKVQHLVKWEEIAEKDIPAAVARQAGFTVVEPAPKGGKAEGGVEEQETG